MKLLLYGATALVGGDRNALFEAEHIADRPPPSPYRHLDYAGGCERTWTTSRSGSGDVAISPVNGNESSKTRNTAVATSVATLATIA